MAFIVPVVRKDYNLYPSVTQAYQQKTKVAGAGTSKNSRLTNSLPLFPTAPKPSEAARIRRYFSEKIKHKSQSSAKQRQSPDPNTGRSSSIGEHRPELEECVFKPNTTTNKPQRRRVTFPPEIYIQQSSPVLNRHNASFQSPAAVEDGDIHRPGVFDKTTETEATSLFNKHHTAATSNQRLRSEAKPIDIPMDSGYTTSETPSPVAESPTTSSMSAPASPTLFHRQPSMTGLILDEEDKENTSATDSAKDDSTPSTSPNGRHVHFGFCEQIEYESPAWEHEPTKCGRLKKLEQKLAAQLKNRFMFRPRAYSMPLSDASLRRKQHDKISSVALKSDKSNTNSGKLSVDDHLNALCRGHEIPPV